MTDCREMKQRDKGSQRKVSQGEWVVDRCAEPLINAVGASLESAVTPVSRE